MLPEEMQRREIYQAREVRAIERIVIEQHGIPGIELMKRAGEFAFKQIMTRHSHINHLLVVCGAGNNGGDGYVVALHARRIGIAVSVLACAKPSTEEAATACRNYCEDGGVVVSVSGDVSGDMTHQDHQYHALFTDADLIVDALFGIGLNRAPEGIGAELIRRMNDANCPIVSLDIPSGLHSDTGVAFSPCVVADMTITFIGLKLGLLSGQGRTHVGKLVFTDLRIPSEARRAVTPVAHIIQPPKLTKLRREIHKGDAGNIWIIGSCVGMLGATLLAGEAALRCGSGLVTIGTDARHLGLPALHQPELMSNDALQATACAAADVVVLGPGLGLSDWSEQVFDRFIDCECLLVVDADALKWLARKPRRRANWVLSPHPGEAAKLLECTTAAVQADRLYAAGEIAAKFGGGCVLKGAGSLVVDENGAAWLCDKGNPGMATAGMGDVLSGILGSLLGQKQLPHSAAAAVWLHAVAGDCAAQQIGERGLLARDVIAHLPLLLRQLEA